MFDYYFGLIESSINKMVLQAHVLLVEEIEQTLKIGCKPYQVAEPLPEAIIITPPHYSSISVALGLPSKKEDLVDFVLRTTHPASKGCIEYLISYSRAFFKQFHVIAVWVGFNKLHQRLHMLPQEILIFIFNLCSRIIFPSLHVSFKAAGTDIGSNGITFLQSFCDQFSSVA